MPKWVFTSVDVIYVIELVSFEMYFSPVSINFQKKSKHDSESAPRALQNSGKFVMFE